jgi:hypothetical protein
MSNEMNEVNAAESVPVAPAPATDPPAESTAEMTDTELIRAALEMEKRFPAPDPDDCKPDARWFTENWKELLRLYLYQYVAIHGGAVVAHGPNPHRVRLDAARKLNISPQRFIVEPVWPVTSLVMSFE